MASLQKCHQMKCRAFAWVVRSTQGFKCDQCKVIDGLDEMGPEVWAVNWDHHPVMCEVAQIQFPNQIWKPISEWAKDGNIGKMIDEFGRVRLLHLCCTGIATHSQINKRMVLESAGLLCRGLPILCGKCISGITYIVNL